MFVNLSVLSVDADYLWTKRKKPTVFLFLCVFGAGPVTDRWPVQSVACLLPNSLWLDQDVLTQHIIYLK